VPRLVILWTRPAHLTRVEADAWARTEVPLVAAAAGIDSPVVTEVRPAALEHPASWHWMLELEVSDDATADRCLRRGPLADWVRDLRLLGMRPTVLLVGEPEVPGAAA
jgi:hypothetical protein